MQRKQEEAEGTVYERKSLTQQNVADTEEKDDSKNRNIQNAKTKAHEKNTQCLSPLREHTMPVHTIHPHPHRRHYPHHLLDHFSGDLTPQTTAQGTWEDVVTTTDTSPAEARTLGEISEMRSAGLYARAELGINSFRENNNRTNPTRTQIQKPIADDSISNLNSPQPWPFFGTESRVLPSGRRVSFLKQACIGFSLLNKANEQQGDNSGQTVCPKAFREASYSSTPRRSLIRGGTKVAELRKRFTETSDKTKKQAMSPIAVDLNKFRNESVQGPNEGLHGLVKEENEQPVKPCVTIIDSSSTKGKHPVPKAPGLRTPVTPPKPKNVKTPNVRPKPNQPSKQTFKTTSPSPTRRKKSPPSWKSDKKVSSPRSNSRGPKIIVPKYETSSTQTQKPANETVTVKSSKPLTVSTPKTTKKIVTKRTKSIKNQMTSQKLEEQYSSPSSESVGEGSSLIVVDGHEIEDEDVTSTYEELSADASEISDRNFLVDYGDPSKFYFRNEWQTKMHGLDESTATMRRMLEDFCTDREIYQGTMDIIEQVEDVKQEMSELYDYFDHFEREEDTLLRQVQRQLVQANRYCRVLHYRLERAEQNRADDKKVHELEEELKLSRQVAVSLHWELQAADSKQMKLEEENTTYRHQLLSAETSREALTIQVTKLQNTIDQMSLHASSQMILTENSNNGGALTSSDSSSEIKRQIQFMEEKEEVMISRLVDLQKEKDSLKDELEQYRDQYGELSTVPSSGANRHTDLKLRLKLAEDQAGLLARKVIELQLENDNMIKMAAEKELMAKEVLKRNPSVSDLQFLEDERESLRLALDEMEIENQKLAAELLRYKQAVHRQLHSNSISTESSLDVGVIIRVPRSNDSVFDDGEKTPTHSHKSEERSPNHHDGISEHVGGDRKKLRPLSLTSPLNQSQKRSSKMSLSRTLSDIAIPLSPDTKSQSVQITPTISSNTTQGTKLSTATNSSRRHSFCHKCKRTKKLKMVDVAIETEEEQSMEPKESVPNSPIKDLTKQTTKSQATSPIFAKLPNIFQPALDVVAQIRERKRSTKSEATSPVNVSRAVTPIASAFTPSPVKSTRAFPRPHNALLEEMRKQLANVRNIAESMNNVVNVEEMDAELERKGRELVDAECKKVMERALQSKKISKLAKSLNKYIKEMEVSVADESEKSEALDGALTDVTGWNLHGNAEIVPIPYDNSTETSTITSPSTSNDDLVSMETVRSLASRIRNKSFTELSLMSFELVVLLVTGYILLASLPTSALFQICFLLLLFFVC